MPKQAILDTLSALARDHSGTALFWHLVLYATCSTMLLVPARPPRNVSGILLTTPVVSVATIALVGRSPVNAVLLTLLLAALLAIALKLPTQPVELATGARAWLGKALLGYAAVYPHFAAVEVSWQLFAFSPLGVLPCPTLASLLGASLLLDNLGSRAWVGTVAAFALLYGLVGALWLGVWLDVVLIVAAAVAFVNIPSGRSEAVHVGPQRGV